LDEAGIVSGLGKDLPECVGTGRVQEEMVDKVKLVV